jgi:glycosyltransferase involved in cell wall biosynthesis
MRIAFASADFGISVFGGKGASIHIQEMVRAFSAAGHEVEVFAPRPGTAPQSFPGKVHSVPVTLPQPTADDLRRAEFEERIFKERRNLAIAGNLAALLKRRHASAPFDFIYERLSLWSTAGVRSARELGIPSIIEMNAPLLEEQQQYRKLCLKEEAAAIEAEIMGHADAIFTVSDAVRQYALRQGANPGHVIVLPNGVDLDRYTPVGEVADIPGFDDLPVIGFSGSLKPWHGLEDLLEAFRLVRERGTECRLLIAGDGPHRALIEGFASGARLKGCIHVAGWIDHKDMPALIRRMDIATAPYPQMEQFYFSPLKLFEYMACGSAVVASDIGQIPSVIQHGENGILSRPGSVAALAGHLEKLIRSPQLRDKLGHAAAASMRGRSWFDSGLKVVETARQLLNNKKAALAS